MAFPTKQSPYAHQQLHFVAIPATFHLYKTGHGTLHILDSDNQSRLYDIKTDSDSSPDISIYRLAATAAAPNAKPILCGSAKFHDWSSTIDLQIGGDRPIPFKAPESFSSSRTFESCVGELKWKHDMRLLNAREELLATFTHDTAASKWGRFEMTLRVAEGGQRLVDEIVLSGVALLEYERREKETSDVAEILDVAAQFGAALA